MYCAATKALQKPVHQRRKSKGFLGGITPTHLHHHLKVLTITYHFTILQYWGNGHFLVTDPSYILSMVVSSIQDWCCNDKDNLMCFTMAVYDIHKWTYIYMHFRNILQNRLPPPRPNNKTVWPLHPYIYCNPLPTLLSNNRG